MSTDAIRLYYPLLLSSFLTALLGGFPLIFVERAEQIKIKEGYCIVVGSWLVACIVGMFPYLIWGGEFTPVNAWFEKRLGIYYHGGIDPERRGGSAARLQFWRMSTAWIGGVGVVMFALVILPSLGKNKLMLSNVELSTIAKDNYQYRTQVIVRILIIVYVGLTLVTTLLLKISGMCWFDAVTHAMSACSTCGFSTKNTSIAFYDSAAIETVLVVAMTLAGIHFGILYATVLGRRNNIFRSEVVRVYVGMMAVIALVVAMSLWGQDVYPSFVDSLRRSLFHVVSITTTSGFAIADTNTWTSLAVVLLLFCSVVCACAGSTAGGMKVNRLLLSGKMIRNRLKLQQHPNAVIRTKIDGTVQDDAVLDSVVIFVVAYIMLILVGTVVNTMFGADLITGFSASIACAGNVGPGFGDVGSMNNYAAFPAILKLNGSLLMLLGRLEIFGFIQLFFIRYWR